VRCHGKRATATLAIVALLAPAFASAEEWNLRRHDEDHDIVVHQRTTDDGHREFRGITHVHTRLSGVIALFRDYARMPEWIYRTAEVRVLEIVNESENYAYTINAMPWPFKDRDAVVRARIRQDPETLAITLQAGSEPDYLPVDERYIRMPMLRSTWRFTPMPDGRTQIEFRGYADPGGQLSSGLVEKFQALLAWQAPYKTLRAMQEIIGDTKYQTADVDFIVEPDGAR
jgi:hypothetical protein